jgi:hypothetical protein
MTPRTFFGETVSLILLIICGKLICMKQLHEADRTNDPLGNKGRRCEINC